MAKKMSLVEKGVPLGVDHRGERARRFGAQLNSRYVR
jgi:hypothetical protein